MSYTYRNLTPHDIKLNDGTVYPPSGVIARVGVQFDAIVDGVATSKFGEVEHLPAAEDGVRCIVSAMVLSACGHRKDVVAPATGHPECVRDKGQIVSVPCFTQLA